MVALFALGVLEWFTLSPEPIALPGPGGHALLRVSVRGAALAVLGLFAFRSWIHERRRMLEERSRGGQGESGAEALGEVQGNDRVRSSGRE
jgi:hypothetical protein